MEHLTLHTQATGNDRYQVILCHQPIAQNPEKLRPLCDSQGKVLEFTSRGCVILAHLLGARTSDLLLEQALQKLYRTL